jgi:hypothetical protein
MGKVIVWLCDAGNITMMGDLSINRWANTGGVYILHKNKTPGNEGLSWQP